MKNLFFNMSMLTALLFGLSACGDRDVKKISGNADDDSLGLALLSINCFSCHDPDPEAGRRVAPPLGNMRQHYLGATESREAFIRRMRTFLEDPSEKNAIMPGAVRKFGLMPKISLKDEDVNRMAGYLFDHDVASADWFEKWKQFQARKSNVDAKMNYEDLGRNIANETKAQIGKNLLVAVQERGPAGAVAFCNTRAIPITDSMANVLHAKVRRVSDKPRNPLNQAEADQLLCLEEWKKVKANGGKPAPRIRETATAVTGYYPIETSQMCMKCHGKPSLDIQPATLDAIRKLYPADKATGYGVDEIRGMFVVEMEKR